MGVFLAGGTGWSFPECGVLCRVVGFIDDVRVAFCGWLWEMFLEEEVGGTAADPSSDYDDLHTLGQLVGAQIVIQHFKV